ncbi:MAG: hypothetical protein RLZZ546_1160 [Bacteroidota bacterium]|jgi:hypothetical protein
MGIRKPHRTQALMNMPPYRDGTSQSQTRCATYQGKWQDFCIQNIKFINDEKAN